MKITLYPKDTPKDIEIKILRAFQSKLTSVFHRAIPSINRRLRGVIDSLIQGTPEYQSLINGELMAEFGLADPEIRLRQILEVLKRSIEVTTFPVQIRGDKLFGGFVFKMIRSDFEEILGLSAATYVSQPSGETIPWLQWLIGEGDKIIIYTHEIYYDLTQQQKMRSRSGMALMRPGSGWRVPPEYAGTLDDNFITRAFDHTLAEQLINKIIIEEVQSRI